MRKESYVDYLLQNYRGIKREILNLEKELENFVPETEDETIEALAFGDKKQAGTQASMFFDRTSHIALVYRQANLRLNSGAVNQIKKMIETGKKEISKLESAIDSLEPQQRNVIKDIYIDNLTWDVVCRRRYISQTSVWRLKKKALLELEKFFFVSEAMA